ncbi:MAG: hypothetical protein RSF79_19105, partial [Janthinobacterium sp.]
EVLDGWLEWWPEGLFAIPLRRRDGVILAWAAFLMEQEPTQLQKQALGHLAELKLISIAYQAIRVVDLDGLRRYGVASL